MHCCGIDWHPNLRIDQNLIARGDLPRSVMDSYEECRGPPRLFLLDKFDIGGVGACLKRYSDPSFFKAELTSSASTKAESQREKKARKIRRKGSQWKIRDTPEGFAKSHAKLHQLFSEERIQTDINVPINHVKLKKRQLNRFLFDSTSGRSYMERFLETRSPEHVLGTQSSVDQLVMRDRYLVPRPSRHEKILEICVEDLAEDVIEEASFEKLPVPTSDIELEKVPSNFYKVEGKKEEMVVGESKTEGSADGYRSDDVISEMENYMDALTTMESELETDTECRPKNERGYFHIERKRMDSNRSEELQELQGRFSDSHSIGNSSASDDGTHSFKKGRSSFSYSNSPSSSAENVLSDGDVALKLDPSTESSSVEFVDVSSAKLCENRDALGTRSSKHLVSSDTYNEVSELPSYSFGLSVNSEEDSNNTSGDLPCRIDVSDFPSQTRDDLVPVASAKGQPEGLLDGRIPNESSDTLLHLPNFSDLDFEKKDSDDAFEEMLPKDNCIKGNLINATLESSHSVSLPTEEQLQGLAEQDLETGSSSTSLPECLPCSPNDNSELDDVEPGEKKATTLTGENSDYLTSVEGDLETGDFVELNFPEMTNEVPLFELDSKKVGITHSEGERLCNNVEVSSDFTTSPTLNRASETEVHLQLNSITGRIHEEVDDIHTVVDCNQVSLLSEDQINLQEECHSPGKDLLQEKHLSRNRGMDQFIVEIPNPSSSDNLTGVDAQKAAMNQAPVSPSELKIMLPNPESYDPSGSKLLSCVHNEMLVEDESHLHLSDCTRVATSLGEGDQESELRKPQSDLLGNAEDATSPSTHSPLELGTTFTEAMESLAEQHNGEKTPLADEEGPKLFNHESEQLQIPSNIYRDVCFDSSQHLSQLPGSQFSQVLASHKVESSEPSTSSISFFPSFDTLHGATHQQLLEPQTIRPVLDLPLPAAEAVEANVMEIPPLPPLPPIEWRIGKLQPRSLASGREVVQSSLNPFSPVTADEPAQWCFPELGRELEQPLNPFLDMNNDKVLDGFGVGREMVQSSLNPFLSPVPMEGDEKIKQDFLALEKNVAQPLNPFLSPVTVNEKSPHCSLDSGVRLVQPDSDEFSPLPSNEDVNAQHPSLNLDGEVVQPLNLFSLIQDREDENSRDTIKFAPSPRTEDKLQHVSLSFEEEMTWQPNLYVIPPMEEEIPNRSRKAWLRRPRDPLIEAVASHDKSTLRKVTERVQPQIGPKVDERDSLLQQIRAKSFNLKPTVGTRPSTQAPKSNLRVAAILEKANAIRQALAGSDEDDDSESWSDS
ncbi:WH2 domain [Macleaya cordata]|uniref:Protein SCAR n=1 Tax=Macleaya cordata TaxID=56857 RepID=A0A200QQF2_MACCD|nr:WH2 domain [Macleaya cordata]